MKSVLISTRPKWCHKIIDGEKKIEVRKTKPKLAIPFKVYIYCSAGSYDWRKDIWATAYFPPSGECTNMSQMVIGEFVCDEISPIRVFENGNIQDYMFHKMEKSCVPYDDIANYIGNGCTGYGWHISDLKIYDKPKELSEFRKSGFMTEEEWLFNLYPNTHCHYEAWAKKFEITRPPQSWCYVEELQNV